MLFICNWFIKLTGWIPQLLIFRTKVYYEDRSVQDKRIKGKAIVVSNHNYLMDFAVLMFVFWRRTLRCAVAEIMYGKNFLMIFPSLRIVREYSTGAALWKYIPSRACP